ncbi:siderophore-interacting protein [Lentzea sp. PSKA42]|uniref:Siderophore-interacting protein n=2 Tax=Lentzea indica TaxID=2604800 RepID=A0ABX1FE86_9PSEU|nr:siderophore-interacting protein [Lentzea indica]
MLRLTVQGGQRVSPHFMSVILAGDDVRKLRQPGPDQAGRLFFAEPGQRAVVLPESERWMLHLTLQPTGRRPRVRTYTIRRFRPEASAIDIEVALHETEPPAGAGSSWALTAAPGDEVAFLDEGHAYAPGRDARWQLLVGDESALPAILSILERSADSLPAEVFLEVPGDEDVRREVTAPAHTRIHWLPRNDTAVRPGSRALDAVRTALLPMGSFYAWVAGESALATGVRRHLVNDRGVPRSAITFRGSWRHGRPSLG